MPRSGASPPPDSPLPEPFPMENLNTHSQPAKDWVLKLK
jgi:hypothetical protein